MAMRPLIFKTSLFRSADPSEVLRSQRALCWLMLGLTRVNDEWLKAYPRTPDLYDTRILYKLETKTEEWCDIPTLLSRGYGDCEDLACYRCADLWRQGVDALPSITWRDQGGKTIYHAIVRYPDGTIEDPSRALGMGGHPITRAPVILPDRFPPLV